MNSPRKPLRILVFTLACLGGTQGCVSRPEPQPSPPAPPAGTTINAPTVVNQPSGNQLDLQVTRDPNNPNRGWVLLGNQPVPVRMEGGSWTFDKDLSGGQQPSPPPQPQSQPQPTPPSPSARRDLSESDLSLTIPHGYMSPGVAHELLLIEKIELYRALLVRMKILAANSQINSVDEFNIIITRLESLLKEMERLQNSLVQPPHQP